MHDGVVRTLIEVRHVPKLKKNLVSVGAMDSKEQRKEIRTLFPDRKTVR